LIKEEGIGANVESARPLQHQLPECCLDVAGGDGLENVDGLSDAASRRQHVCFGFTSKAMVVGFGTSSRSSSSRLGPSEAVKKLAPVTLPPGRFTLATSPCSTGSLPIAKTIGIFVVAAFAARAEGVPLMAAITAT